MRSSAEVLMRNVQCPLCNVTMAAASEKACIAHISACRGFAEKHGANVTRPFCWLACVKICWVCCRSLAHEMGKNKCEKRKTTRNNRSEAHS